MIIVSFDVLALPNTISEDIGARQPSPEGRRLWASLFASYNGSMAVFASGVTNQEGCLHWLKRENFKASTVDMIESKTLNDKVNRITNLHAVYGRINWYIDTDPEVIAKVSHNGIPTLLVTVPHVIRPEWSESRTRKAWDDLVQEAEQQALARAERNWGDV